MGVLNQQLDNLIKNLDCRLDFYKSERCFQFPCALHCNGTSTEQFYRYPPPRPGASGLALPSPQSSSTQRKGLSISSATFLMRVEDKYRGLTPVLCTILLSWYAGKCLLYSIICYSMYMVVCRLYVVQDRVTSPHLFSTWPLQGRIRPIGTLCYFVYALCQLHCYTCRLSID